MNLIVFTSSYPYVQGGEANFLSSEMRYLSASFDRVIVIPEVLKAVAPIKQTGIEAETGYANLFAATSNYDLFFLAQKSQIFYEGMKEHTFPRLSIRSWRRLIAFSGKAELVRRWTLDWLERNNMDLSKCIFYTYWFDHAATGLAFIRKSYPDVRLVSRAHGYDTFENEYYSPAFFPCRLTTFPLVDKVFSASQAGVEYFKRRYPEYAIRMDKSLLGVTDPKFQNQPSQDGVFRLVSCSMIRPEKRVELILAAIKHTAELCPEQKFEWVHIGNGNLRAELQAQADREFPSNAIAFFEEYFDLASLMDFYKQHPVDVFVNLSETEGTPVSIMEAISCGIPVLATAVGGNKEIVTEKNGILVSKNFSLDEVSSAIFGLIESQDEIIKKRLGSRNVWKDTYNAEINFRSFANILKQIRLNL